MDIQPFATVLHDASTALEESMYFTDSGFPSLRIFMVIWATVLKGDVERPENRLGAVRGHTRTEDVPCAPGGQQG